MIAIALSGLAALGSAVLFGHAVIRPSIPWEPRIVAEGWAGAVGIVASLMFAGAQVAAMLR